MCINKVQIDNKTNLHNRCKTHALSLWPHSNIQLINIITISYTRSWFFHSLSSIHQHALTNIICNKPHNPIQIISALQLSPHTDPQHPSPQNHTLTNSFSLSFLIHFTQHSYIIPHYITQEDRKNLLRKICTKSPDPFTKALSTKLHKFNIWCFASLSPNLMKYNSLTRNRKKKEKNGEIQQSHIKAVEKGFRRFAWGWLEPHRVSKL